MSAKVLGLLANHGMGYASIKNEVEFTLEAAIQKDNNVTLFRSEDMHLWVTFTCVFAVLITFDNVVLNRNPKALTMTRAVVYTLFWMFMAGAFCLWISYTKGTNAGYMWMSGYLLEWMLSFDNLFVFHMIFSVYGCPDNLKHRPLYLGILGAVVFRLAFIFIGEYLMHAFAFMHLIFGAFLIYTGIQTVSGDEDEEDPSQHPFVMWLQSKVSFVSVYCAHGSFFVKVPLNEEGEAVIKDEAYVKATETTPLNEEEEQHARYPVVDFEVANQGHQGRTETKATMLFLVVLCLEISDILFAVDSVSAIVSAVNDLFLAYTSTVFAMLGLRATFFVIDVLVQLFSLLSTVSPSSSVLSVSSSSLAVSTISLLALCAPFCSQPSVAQCWHLLSRRSTSPMMKRRKMPSLARPPARPLRFQPRSNSRRAHLPVQHAHQSCREHRALSCHEDAAVTMT